MQNAAYPPQYNAGAQPVPMPEQVGYYAAPAMLGGPVPGRPSYVLPQAPQVGSWPLPPATTQMVPGMAPPPAPANEEPTKVVRAKGVATSELEPRRGGEIEETRGSRRPSTVPSLPRYDSCPSHDAGVVFFDRAGRGARCQAKLAEDLRKARVGRTASGVEQHWQVMTGQRQRNGATVPKGKSGAASQRCWLSARKMGQQTERRTSARWTQDEENRLREAVSELGKGKWTLVADDWALDDHRRRSSNTGRSSPVKGNPKVGTRRPIYSIGRGRWARRRRARRHLSWPVVRSLLISRVWRHQESNLERRAALDGRPTRNTSSNDSSRRWARRASGGSLLTDYVQVDLQEPSSNWQIMTGGRKGSSATRLAQQRLEVEDGDGDAKRSRATKTRAVAHRWTPQEEAQLSALVEELGPRGKWGQIAEKLASGRTSSGVEQHWKIMHGAHHGAKKARLAPAAPPTLVAAAAPPPAMLGQARPISHGQVPGQWVPGLPGQPYQYQVMTDAAGRPVQARRGR